MAEAAVLVGAVLHLLIGPGLTTARRPSKFVKNTYGEDEDEDSTVGKMPPSDSEEEGS